MKKYGWQFCFIVSSLFLLEFLMYDFELWPLVGSLIFGLQSFIIYIQKDKQTKLKIDEG